MNVPRRLPHAQQDAQVTMSSSQLWFFMLCIAISDFCTCACASANDAPRSFPWPVLQNLIHALSPFHFSLPNLILITQPFCSSTPNVSLSFSFSFFFYLFVCLFFCFFFFFTGTAVDYFFFVDVKPHSCDK